MSQSHFARNPVLGVYSGVRIGQAKEEGKDQESIQSSTKPDPGHHLGKWQKIKHHTQESQEVNPFQADDHKTAISRQDSITDTKHK